MHYIDFNLKFFKLEVDPSSPAYKNVGMKRREFLASILPMPLFVAAACAKRKSAFPLGVCDWSAGLVGNPSIMDFAKNAGLNGVQISSKISSPKLPFFSDSEIAAYKARMLGTGMAVCSIGATCMNAHPFYAANGAVDYIKSAVDAAVKLDCKNILLPFYGPADMRKKGSLQMNGDFFKPLVERLKAVAPYAENAGVGISLENSLSSADDIKILDAVGSPNVNIYFDVMNFGYYGHTDTPSHLRALKGRIGQIHLKSSEHLLNTGKGHPSDMAGCLQAIKDIDYNGWLVFESHRFTPSKEFGALELFKSNAEFVKSSILFL